MPMDIDFANQTSSNGKSNGNPSNNFKGKQRAPGTQPKKKQITCYRCGKLGHIAKNCRVRLNALNQEVAGSSTNSDLEQRMEGLEATM